MRAWPTGNRKGGEKSQSIPNSTSSSPCANANANLISYDKFACRELGWPLRQKKGLEIMTGPKWGNDSNENKKTSTPTHGQPFFMPTNSKVLR